MGHIQKKLLTLLIVSVFFSGSVTNAFLSKPEKTFVHHPVTHFDIADTNY